MIASRSCNARSVALVKHLAEFTELYMLVILTSVYMCVRPGKSLPGLTSGLHAQVTLTCVPDSLLGVTLTYTALQKETLLHGFTTPLHATYNPVTWCKFCVSFTSTAM